MHLAVYSFSILRFTLDGELWPQLAKHFDSCELCLLRPERRMEIAHGACVFQASRSFMKHGCRFQAIEH